MLITREDVAKFVTENATDVTDLAKVDQMQKTDDPRLARTLECELRRKHDDAAMETDRESIL